MSGLAIVFGSIIVGQVIATFDPIAGLALIVVGSLGGLIVTWSELS